MDSSVNASAMFPQLRLTPARAAFARPGPHATAFPDVNALMQPSDSLVPLGRRSGRPSPAAYPGAEVLFFTAAPVPPLTGATPGDISTPAPHKPALSRGDTRGSQVPGPSSSCVPCSTTPAGCDRPLAHLSVRSLLPSGCLTPWAPWAPWKADSFRGCMAHGPLARVPTLRRIRYRFRHKARYRPGGLTLGRAGFAPAG